MWLERDKIERAAWLDHESGRAAGIECQWLRDGTTKTLVAEFSGIADIKNRALERGFLWKNNYFFAGAAGAAGVAGIAAPAGIA